MTVWRIVLLTSLSLLAFAGNSLLSRAAFTLTAIDANSFTLLRLLAGALVLYLLWKRQSDAAAVGGNWPAAICLFGYAILFSYAYLQLNTATGALLLFAAVQLTMLSQSLWRREPISMLQWFGAVMALGGMLYLLLPGATAPQLAPALLMMGAGIAWGIYSLLGRQGAGALATTAGNFVRASPLALLPFVLTGFAWQWDWTGALLAIVSGAITSGLGYAIWYQVLPKLSAMQAASVQLAVPVVAAILAVVILAEPLQQRLVLSGTLVLLGLGLVLLCGRRRGR